MFVFRRDLRVQDNAALFAHEKAQRLLCVYVEEPSQPWFQVRGVGEQRSRFLRESLCSLQAELRSVGQDLLYVKGYVHQVIPRLAARFNVARINIASVPGVHEQASVERLTHSLSVPLNVLPGNQLFPPSSLDAWMPSLPPHFTPFCKALMKRRIESPLEVASLPPPPVGLDAYKIPAPTTRAHPAFAFKGGEQAARVRLETWMFRERSVDHYLESRNDLEGLFSSSNLSPWLANGSLSVRSVAKSLFEYEREYGKSRSSEHLLKELLWREFFQWRALRDPASLFHRGGARRRLTLCTFEPRSYARWCAGSTDVPLVNALMHQLVETGWMSNRGRQIAASYLINEMGMDWRYGAAFFEKHLIDYDVASNYGNWQYIAGVGADPRGGRHFNQEKQAALYDKDGTFTARWRGHCQPQPEYVNDAADWPMSIPENHAAESAVVDE
ncbi:hypothetical protein BST95_08175 [Halioglobus japonicus]|nr:hypothetical protein BST95_08175 [Halioglobus japonicus]